MQRTIILLFGLLTWLSAGAARADLLDEIDARYRTGRITEAQHQLYRVAAVRDRALLPSDLRTASIGDRGGRDVTPIMVEGYQWAARHGDEGRALLRLLQPIEGPLYMDSATLPIRVRYTSPSEAGLASEVLVASEYSWRVQTEEYGFYTPLFVGDRYDVSIEPTGFGAGGYTVPYEQDPSKSHHACFTYIVIDPSLGVGAEAVVAHEFNHAMQAAMDCQEVVSFWENTATYIETKVYPESFAWMVYSMYPYQRQPWRALDYMNRSQSDGYEYGGMLWPLYLADTYAPDDGPILLRQIWEAGMQPLGEDNDPDCFDAIREVVARRGGPSLEEVFLDFSVARYFVGVNDDGEHMSMASELEGVEVVPVAEISPAALPVVEKTPQATELPAPFGSNHIIITTLVGRDYTFTFSGDPSTRWAVRVVAPRVQSDALEVVDLTLDHAVGEATVNAGKRRQLMLVVANLGKAGYSPNKMQWPRGAYSFGVRMVIPAPTISTVEPAELARTGVPVAVKIRGSGFVAGSGFAVAFADPLIQVVAVDKVQSGEVDVTVRVDESAALGANDVTVTNFGGAQGVGPGLLTIVRAPGEGGCSTASGSADGWAPGLLLAALLLAARHRLRRAAFARPRFRGERACP